MTEAAYPAYHRACMESNEAKTVRRARPGEGNVARSTSAFARRRAANPFGLTDREVDVAEAAAQGLDTAEMAKALCITPQGVKFHLSAIYGQVGVPSRAALVARWIREVERPNEQVEELRERMRIARKHIDDGLYATAYAVLQESNPR
jgi:DNA-binding CsgD family transcriptional regulator